MSLPQSNYTMVPNIVIENLPELKESSIRCIFAIVRATIGYHTAKHRCSIPFLMAKTGLSRQGVVNGTTELLEKDWVDRDLVGQTYEYWLKLEIKEPVNQVDGSAELTSQASRRPEAEPVNQVDGQAVNQVDPYKERDLKKKDPKEKEIPPTPQGGTGQAQGTERVNPVEVEISSLSSEKGETGTTADQPRSEACSSAAPPPKTGGRRVPNYQRWIDTYLAHKPKAWKGMEFIAGDPAREKCVERGLKAYKGNEDEALRRLELALKYVKKENDDFWVNTKHSFATILRRETMHMIGWAESAIEAGLTTGDSAPALTPDDLEARKARRQAEILAQARAESDRLMQGAA
jgi:hypothetical protein